MNHRICTECGKPIILVPSANERAKNVGGKPSDYLSIFTMHSECELKKRSNGDTELIRRLQGK